MAKRLKFKKGDTITAIYDGRGVDKATVMSIIKQDGKYFYKCKIMNGVLILPSEAEEIYTLHPDYTKKST